jgi:hypothetical protein
MREHFSGAKVFDNIANLEAFGQAVKPISGFGF